MTQAQREGLGEDTMNCIVREALERATAKALAAKTAPEWTASDLRRSIVAHGKELNPTKEVIANQLADKYSPAEIMEHTEPLDTACAQFTH